MVTVNSQDGNDQLDDLKKMNRNRNSSLLGDCDVLSNIILTCPMLEDQTLTVDGLINLQGIEIRIRLCDSSLWFLFTYSNGTFNTTNDYLKTPTEINLDQLTLYTNIATCLNADNQSVIQISVRVHAEEN